MKIDLGIPGLACYATCLPLDTKLERENECLLPDTLKKAAFIRRTEFIAGRLCAREAGSELGLSIDSLPVGPTRSPLWPTGMIGSISHSRRLAIACVGSTGKWASVGIDTEVRLDKISRQNIAPVIATEEEQKQIEGHSDKEQDLAYTVLFSAKEAFYKAIHPLQKKFIDFKEVRLSKICLSSGKFTLETDVVPGSFEGRFLVQDNNVITVLPIEC